MSDSEIVFLDTKVYKSQGVNRESTLDVQTHYITKREVLMHEVSIEPSTKHKEGIHKRRSATPPKNKFVTLHVGLNRTVSKYA